MEEIEAGGFGNCVDGTDLVEIPAYISPIAVAFNVEGVDTLNLDPATLARATGVSFPGRRGVLPGFGLQRENDWGLGLEIRGTKSPHWTGSRNSPETFGHFGQSGTFLWVDPRAGAALVALSDRPFGEWAAQAWPPYSDGVLDALAHA